MQAAIAHRGPDAEGAWTDPERPVHLGHRRLSIVDLAGGGQPMNTADGDLVITFNGEIYNHAELRLELQRLGHRFQSDHSDTEVLLHGYREWGGELPHRLNGMWAFALYDRPRRQLFLSRDRFGKKPLFYCARPGLFAFASELSALVAHLGVPRELSRRALQKLFGYGYIPAPLSLYEGVRKLPGGCNLLVEADTLAPREERYWEYLLDPWEHEPADPEAEWGGQLRDILGRAVRRRLMSDVPLGVFLSGGVDSSAVTALAAPMVAAAGGRLQTFSIGFEEASFDESVYARQVADRFGTEHWTETLSMEKARRLAPEIVGVLDEPMGDASLLPTSLLCGFARQRVTVALGGDGGDELFAGYDPFLALRRAELYQRAVPRPVHRAIALLAARLPVSHANMSLDFKLKRTLRGLGHSPRLWLPTWMAPLDAGEVSELLSGPPLAPEDLFSEAIEAWENCSQQDSVDRTLQFYTRLYLQDDILVKADRASMMHGLELRAPFLDIEVADFARRLPHRWKLRGGRTKYLLKKALEPLLPREILYRSKKGFGVPIGQWFQDGGLPFDATLASTRALGLERPFLERRHRAHLAGRSDERALLWNAYVLAHCAPGRHQVSPV